MAAQEQKTQERLAVILQVLSGQLTAVQGAERLNISRKSYYEWQDRALTAMRDALTDRNAGRPPIPVDTQKQDLQAKVQDLSDQLLLAQKTIEVKNILTAYAAQQKSLCDDSRMSGKKKSTPRKL
jgi:hypothetical protein